MRREQTRAAVRSKDCMQGRVKPGHYELEGLNLFDRRGNTIANRVEPGGMDKGAVKCVATAFKAIRNKVTQYLLSVAPTSGAGTGRSTVALPDVEPRDLRGPAARPYA